MFQWDGGEEGSHISAEEELLLFELQHSVSMSGSPGAGIMKRHRAANLA